MIGGAAMLAGMIVGQAAATIVTFDGHYQEGKSSGCSAPPATFCRLDFTLVPANKRLVIEQVSCYLRTDQTAAIQRWLVVVSSAAGSSTIISSSLNPIALAATTVSRTFQVNDQVAVLVNSNLKPQVRISLSKGDITSLNCNITGTMTQIPPT